MIKKDLILPEYENLIGWRPHYDLSEINIDPNLSISETSEFYQDKHAALDLSYIQTCLPPNRDLGGYLLETVNASTSEMINDLLQYRKLKRYGKEILDRKVLLQKYGWVNDKIINRNRFVGFQIKVKSITGLVAVIEEVGVQLDAAQTLPMYLFHTSKIDPIAQFDLVATGTNWDWVKNRIELSAFESGNFNEGAFILGYYQEDLSAQAINYSNFDWQKGVCGYCPGNSHLSKDWRAVTKHFSVYPIYVPNGSYTKGLMFDMKDSTLSQYESFGLNLRLTVRCDLTDFFIENKLTFKNLLAWKVVYKVLQMMKFSQQINYIEENIKMMIIRDLEGDVDTKLTNVPSMYDKELKAVAFDISGINSECLPCEDKATGVRYSAI